MPREDLNWATRRLHDRLVKQCQRMVPDETVVHAWAAETGPGKDAFRSRATTVTEGWKRKHYLIALTQDHVYVFAAKLTNMFKPDHKVADLPRTELREALSEDVALMQADDIGMRIEPRWAPLVSEIREG